MLNLYFSFDFFSSILASFFFSFVVVITFGNALIKFIQKKSFLQPSADRGPESHKLKNNTPTMGGILIVFAIISSNLLFSYISLQVLLFNLGLTLFALLGFLDDYLKIFKKNISGLSSKMKFLVQILISATIYVLYHMYSHPTFVNSLYIPILADYILLPSVVMCGFFILVLTASTNAVNLTDGLDGLVSLVLLPVFLAMLTIGYFDVNVQANYNVCVILAGILGSLLGFLWFNSYPARIFMGDVGSLPLGFALGCIAIFLKQEFLLLLLAGIPVVEAISVILQVAYFKFTGGKRIFKMSPLHHHFELGGVPEQKVVMRFFITSTLLALLSIYSVL